MVNPQAGLDGQKQGSPVSSAPHRPANPRASPAPPVVENVNTDGAAPPGNDTDQGYKDLYGRLSQSLKPPKDQEYAEGSQADLDAAGTQQPNPFLVGLNAILPTKQLGATGAQHLGASGAELLGPFLVQQLNAIHAEVRIATSTQQLDAARAELKATGDELKKTRDELNEARDGLNAELRTRDKLETTRDKLKTTRDKLRGKLEATRDDLRTKVDELEATRDELRTMGDRLKTTGDRLNAELETTRAELKEARDGLKATGDELEATHGELKAARCESKAMGNELEAARGELKTTGNKLRAAGNELEATRGELKAARDELKKTHDKLKATGDELEATRDHVFRLQPPYADLTESEAAALFKMLYSAVQNLVRSRLGPTLNSLKNGRLQNSRLQNSRLQSDLLHNGHFKHSRPMPAQAEAFHKLMKKAAQECRGVSGADEYQIIAVVMAFLDKEVFGESSLFFVLKEEISVINDTYNKLFNFRKDFSHCRTWRSEALTAFANNPERGAEKEKYVGKVTEDLYFVLSAVFDLPAGAQLENATPTSEYRLQNSVRNEIVLPAVELANRLELATSIYSFQWPPDSPPWDLRLYHCLDLAAGGTLAPQPPPRNTVASVAPVSGAAPAAKPAKDPEPAADNHSARRPSDPTILENPPYSRPDPAAGGAPVSAAPVGEAFNTEAPPAAAPRGSSHGAKDLPTRTGSHGAGVSPPPTGPTAVQAAQQQDRPYLFVVAPALVVQSVNWSRGDLGKARTLCKPFVLLQGDGGREVEHGGKQTKKKTPGTVMEWLATARSNGRLTDMTYTAAAGLHKLKGVGRKGQRDGRHKTDGLGSPLSGDDKPPAGGSCAGWRHGDY